MTQLILVIGLFVGLAWQSWVIHSLRVRLEFHDELLARLMAHFVLNLYDLGMEKEDEEREG